MPDDTGHDRLGEGGWVPVPVWLVGLVSDGALATWVAVAAHRNARSGTAWPGVPTLARERGKDERSIQRHLSELIAAGVLTSTPTRRPDGSQGSNTYRLVETRPPQPVDNLVGEPVGDARGGGINVTGGVA